MIAFYYGITGFACPIYYRRELFKSTRNAIMVGLAPLLGGLILAWVFIKSCIDLANPEFFRRRPEVVGPDGTAISAPTIAPDEQGGISDGR
jgi:hypothetical protein